MKLPVVILLGSVLASPAMADWGDMLKDLKDAGESALNSNSEQGSDLNNQTIIDGLREALATGSRRAIDTVSQEGGYLNNPEIRIPLPGKIQQASDVMKKFGMSQLAEDFETSINRAAEKAAPQATDLMIGAIQNMSIDDAKKILNGGDDAATKYFEDKTRTQLADLFSPVIDDSLNQVGATRYYNQLDDRMQDVPLVGQNLNMDLNSYVTDEALNGLFAMLAAEEQKIRENPAARTSELLKTVFSK